MNNLQQVDWSRLPQPEDDGGARHLAGMRLPASCTKGLCGTCKVQVCGGEVDHGAANPFALMDFERDDGKTLACCATLQADTTIEADIDDDPDALRGFEGKNFMAINGYGPGDEARVEALTRPFVGAFSVFFQRRKRGRQLHDFTAQACQRRFHVRIRQCRNVANVLFGRFGVVGGGNGAETVGGLVSFSLALQGFDEFGGPARA